MVDFTTPPGQMLQALRLAAGFSQGALAAKADVSQQEVSALERGERRGQRATWQRIAALLGVPAEEFFSPSEGRGR